MTLIDFVSELLLPTGLVTIMFGLGLAVSLSDLARIYSFPRAILVGVAAQIVVIPLIGVLLALLLDIDPVLAISLIVIASCPGGVTSNILVFHARADIALSILLTASSSIIAIFTVPAVISLALHLFPEGRPEDIPNLAGLTGNLFLFSALPIIAGVLCRMFWTSLAARILIVLRPASLGILLTVIGFSVLINREFVAASLIEVVPVALLLNLTALGIGLAITKRFHLSPTQAATVAIELSVQNVTMATFLGMSVLGSARLAAAPTIYGVLMVCTAIIFLNIWKRRGAIG